MLGVVLLAHGSRDPLWRQPVEAVARQLKLEAPDRLVRCAYLESCEPDLDTAVGELLACGITRLRILPLFFGMGRHAREDLPRLIAGLQTRHPQLALHCLPAAGEDPRLTALLARMALGDPSP